MFNQVTIAGRITNELQLKHTTNGKPVLNFSIAINEKRGEQEQTIFADVTAWNGTAENVAQYMGKGSSVLIDGRLSQDRWEEEGRNRTKLFVTAERVVFLDSKGDSAPTPAKKGSSKKEKAG